MMLVKATSKLLLSVFTHAAHVSSNSSCKFTFAFFLMGTYFSSSWTLCLHVQGHVPAWFNQLLHFVISFAGSAREKQCWKPMPKVEAFPMAVLRQKDFTVGQVSSPRSSKSSEMSNHPFQLPSAIHQQEETAH